jgi:peptidylprolyl isomerase
MPRHTDVSFRGAVRPPRAFLAAFLVVSAGATSVAAVAEAPARMNAIEIVAHSAPADWRPVDPENTLYVELASGRVVIELAPEFAPLHVKNLKALAREKYFDGMPIVRVQDDYVTEWEDADEPKRPVKTAVTMLPPEFTSAIAAGQQFIRLPDGDVYAPEVGFTNGYPVAREPKSGQRWLAHCYGMLGLGRDSAPDSGFGGSPFVVLGHTRNLDRNDTLLGHVVHGIELLSTLPRGTGVRGFFEKREQMIPIRSIRVAADVPPAERTEVEVMKVDSATFQRYVEARRSPPDAWFVQPAGKTDVCHVRVPSRLKPPTAR